MTVVINLRMARKAKARVTQQADAQANRARHGRTKAERQAIEAEGTRLARAIEGARRED